MRKHLRNLIFLATAFAAVAAVAGTNSASLYFVQISDTHFGDPDAAQRTRKVVDSINALPFDIRCVVHTGDITLNRLGVVGVVSNALMEFGRLRAPVHYVPGNHDITRRRIAETSQIFTNRFGPLVGQAEYGGVAFVFAYTEPSADDFAAEGFDPLKEVEAALKKAEGKPVLLFTHTPPADDFYNNKMHEGWSRRTREPWSRLLQAHNVKAVLAGHFHRDEFHWLGGVPVYACPAVAGTWGRQATYRIYEYKEGKISYRTQYVE